MMKYFETMKSRRKELIVSKQGILTMYPILHETKEVLKRTLKKLIHIRKGL
jgi:hypothetical protein